MLLNKSRPHPAFSHIPPEVSFVSADSLRRAVRRRCLQHHDLHVPGAVATGTGHVALPDAGSADIDVGQDEFAAGQRQGGL